MSAVFFSPPTAAAALPIFLFIVLVIIFGYVLAIVLAQIGERVHFIPRAGCVHFTERVSLCREIEQRRRKFVCWHLFFAYCVRIVGYNNGG